MTDAVRFVIDGEPVGKGRPRVDTRRGFAHIHSTTKDIHREALIRSLAREAMGGREPFPWAVRITIEAVFEVTPSWTKKRKAAAISLMWHTAKPDSDNIAKSVLDGLLPGPKGDKEPFCIVDDTHVADLRVTKRYGYPARTEVIIEPLVSPEGIEDLVSRAQHAPQPVTPKPGDLRPARRKRVTGDMYNSTLLAIESATK